VLPDFSLAVVGAPYPNKDGSNREFEIRLLDPGDELSLLPEPKNRFDEHAVAVISNSGTQIGYVETERAPHLGILLRAGHELHARFQARTPWGCIVRIGIDRAPSLPPAAKAADPSIYRSDPDIGFEPDWIPPDD
jgi:hypothetical protein